MSQISQHDKQNDLTNLFLDQMDHIIKKKSVVISPSKFPPGVPVEVICERLDMLLEGLQPPVYLEQLYMVDYQIPFLPLEFYLLLSPKLRVLDLHNNHLSFFPSNLGTCSNLESLNLSFNSIKFIQLKDILMLSSLRHLLLEDNKLSFLPPALGELTNLEALEISGNPLILPPLEFRDSSKNKICELQAYLVSNRLVLDQQIENQAQSFSRPAPPLTPSFVRTRSVSDTRTKSSKASRRMGLIINNSKSTPENAFTAAGSISNESTTPSKPERKLLLPGDGKYEVQKDNEVHDLNIDNENIKRAQINSGSMNASKVSDGLPLFKDAEINRNRANTLKNEILAVQSEFLDSDTKLSTFPRRLSTLQERPLDEFSRAPAEYKFQDANRFDDLKSPLRGNGCDISPSKSAKRPFGNNSENASHYQSTPNPLFNSHMTYNSSILTQMVKTIIHSLKDIHKSLILLMSETKPATSMEILLQPFSDEVNGLQGKLDFLGSGEDNQQSLANILVGAIASFKGLLSTLNENVKFLVKSQTYALRTIYLSLFGAINEMQNAHKLILNGFTSFKTHPPQQSAIKSSVLVGHSQSETVPKNVLQAQAKDNIAEGYSPEVSSSEIDGRLLIAVEYSTADALVVLRELTNTVNAHVNSSMKNPQNMNPTLASKCNNLHSVCSTTMEITRTLMTNLSSFQLQKTLQAKKLLWDDINAYLKAVLTIFAAVKGIMNDAPVLNDARPSMANLTKSTKEVTILLEASSFKSSSDLQTSTLNTNLSQLGMSQFLLSTPIINSSSSNLQQLSNSIAAARTPSVPVQTNGVSASN